jgi:hypothetical protein
VNPLDIDYLLGMSNPGLAIIKIDLSVSLSILRIAISKKDLKQLRLFLISNLIAQAYLAGTI